MKNVVSCVNYIQSQGLNHQQFKLFLQARNCNYPDVNYFRAIRWLSRAATLKRFWDLKEAIQTFMESKGEDISFLKNDTWLKRFCFFDQHHPSPFRVECEAARKRSVSKQNDQIHFLISRKTTTFFLSQLSKESLTHFLCLESRKVQIQYSNCEKYAGMVEKLTLTFEIDFEEL